LAALAPVLEKALDSLHADGEIRRAAETYFDVRTQDPESRGVIFGKLLAWIHKGNIQRYGKPKPRTPIMEDEA
jgi:hypothetical protein